MEPNEPAAPSAPAEVVPATPAPPAAETPAPGSLEELRASLGMPAKPGEAAPAKETPPAASTEPAKATEPVVEEAKDDSDYALRISRLARLDRTARAERAAADEARKALDEKEKELHGAAKESATLREARDLYAKGESAKAVAIALGLESVPEDLFLQLASSGNQPLDRAAINALVAKGVETELGKRDQATKDATAAEQARQEEIITSFEANHIESANVLFEERAEKSWPNLSRFVSRGTLQAELVTREYIEQLQASAEKGATAEPAALFDSLEAQYSELFGVTKTPEVSKTIGENLKKGVVASASNGEPKEPQDRWAAAYEAKEKWITEKLREKGLK